MKEFLKFLIIPFLFLFYHRSKTKTPKGQQPIQPTTPVPDKEGLSVLSRLGILAAVVVCACLIIALISGVVTFVHWCNTPNLQPAPSALQLNPLSFGEGYATKEGIKAYLDPWKTHTRPIGTVKYTLIGDSSKWITEKGPTNGNDGIDINKWYRMPAGYYIVTSEENAYFKWYQ